MKKRRRPKPEGEGDGLAELEATVTERYEQGQELAAKQAQERIDLEVKQRDRLLALASQHATELAELEALHIEQVAKLWGRQGRPLGAWATGGHWRGEQLKNGGPYGSQR